MTEKDKTIRVDEPIGIIAVGVEGRASINYLQGLGCNDITALDARVVEDLPPGVKVVFGDGYDRDLTRFSTIFKSPGIRPDHPSLIQARNEGTHVTSALSHFLERCPCPVVGMTGTVGKGTACSIAAASLEEAGFTTHLGGNIGKSPLDFLDLVEPDHRVVLEISSFQAMDLSVSPPVGAILKTTSEHLDWHVDTAEYRLAKSNMLAHQTPDDAVIFNMDEEGSREIAAASSGRRFGYSLRGPVEQGIFLDGGSLYLKVDGNETVLPIDPKGVGLRGRFNLENIAAGICAAIVAGGDVDPVCRAAASFKSLPHRLELAATGGGIFFYNDSYATRPEAAVAAIRAFDGPLALVMGGSEKHADFTELVQVLKGGSSIVQVGLIGATARRMEEAIRAGGQPPFTVLRFETLEEAMESGASALGGDGTLLMAPACASFGLFQNYKVRGERFRAKARELAGLGPVG